MKTSYSCTICGKPFKSERGLKVHQRAKGHTPTEASAVRVALAAPEKTHLLDRVLVELDVAIEMAERRVRGLRDLRERITQENE